VCAWHVYHRYLTAVTSEVQRQDCQRATKLRRRNPCSGRDEYTDAWVAVGKEVKIISYSDEFCEVETASPNSDIGFIRTQYVIMGGSESVLFQSGWSCLLSDIYCITQNV